MLYKILVAFFLLDDFPASELYMPTFRKTVCYIFIGGISTAYADITECSETSAYKILTPGYHPKERIHFSEHDGSLRLCVIGRVVLDVSNDFIAVGPLAPEDEGTTKLQ
jgi:hypothetical protein